MVKYRKVGDDMKRRILVVEDEQDTREAVCEFLLDRGYDVMDAVDGEDAIQAFENHSFDMVLLDIMLPKVNGFVVLHTIRKNSSIPVLMLTAMNDEYTQIMSFDEQADDYITKPFSLLLLEKRMEALFRRMDHNHVVSQWSYRNITVDFQGFCAYDQGRPIDIKPKELQLLKVLLDHAGQVMTRIQLLDAIWKDESPLDRVIDVYIKNLRKKLHLDCIVTIKGIGYKLENRQ